MKVAKVLRLKPKRLSNLKVRYKAKGKPKRPLMRLNKPINTTPCKMGALGNHLIAMAAMTFKPPASVHSNNKAACNSIS